MHDIAKNRNNVNIVTFAPFLQKTRLHKLSVIFHEEADYYFNHAHSSE